MDESRIVIAIKKFMADYAWDKSLTTRTTNSFSLTSQAPDMHVSGAQAIEEFTNATRK